MFGIVKDFLAKKKNLGKYQDVLTQCLSDGKLDSNEKKLLEKMASDLGLEPNNLLSLHKKATSFAFNAITSDRKITEEEKQSLDELMTYFKVETKDFNFDQKTFNKFYALGLIDKGVLPKVSQHDIDIVFKNDEIVHWGCPAELKKFKRITNRVRYSGPVASIKIMKGVRYRIGSVSFKTESSEFLATEDVGPFWITNYRIGFRGGRKNFAIPISKILSFELTSDGLSITKEGKETPYLISLDDYEVPCAIVSHLLNR